MLKKKATPLTEGLAPRLGLFTCSMIVIGSIIGSGIFKKIAPMTLKLQSESLVLSCWVIAGLITLFGALTYAEIAGRLAQTGGLYAYLRSIYGKKVGYFFGWSCFSVIQSASIASIAYVLAEAILRVFPSSLHALEPKVVATGTILTLTVVNCLGLIWGAWIENIFTSLKVLGILLVAVLAFAFKESAPSPAVVSSGSTIVPSGTALISAMFSAMLGAFWAYDGLNDIGFIGGEVREARHTIPRSLIVGVLGILLIYLVVNMSYFHALSIESILSIARTPGKIFAIEMFQKTLGSSWALFVAVLIMVSTFGATNGSILTSARIYFAMASDGVFFKVVGRVSKHKTPVFALLFQGLWASCLVFLGTFDDLTDMLIFASFIFYGLGAYGLFLLRKNRDDYSGFVVPSVIPAIYTLFCFTLVIVTLFQDPLGSGKGLLLIAAGFPLYIWFTKNILPKNVDGH